MNDRSNRASTTFTGEKAKIIEVLDHYVATIIAHDGEGWMALWDEEGAQLAPNQPPHAGKAAIREANFDFFNDPSRSWAFHANTQEVLVFGDGFALARGLYGYTATSSKGEPTLLMDGKFMTLFKKQADGRWLLYRDCFNSNTP